MRVAVIVAFVSLLTTPSEASTSCTSKTEARQRFGTVYLYWHRPEHCWDATPTHPHGVRHRVHHPEPEPLPWSRCHRQTCADRRTSVPPAKYLQRLRRNRPSAFRGAAVVAASQALQAGLPSVPEPDSIDQAAAAMVTGTNCWLAQTHISGGTAKPGVTRDDLSQPVHSGAWGAEKGIA